MSDDANVQGVPVLAQRPDIGPGTVYWSMDDGDVREGVTPSHVAHSLSDKAQAARREAVARAISGGAELENWDYATAAAVLRVLGLGGDADATNGGG